MSIDEAKKLCLFTTSSSGRLEPQRSRRFTVGIDRPAMELGVAAGDEKGRRGRRRGLRIAESVPLPTKEASPRGGGVATAWSASKIDQHIGGEIERRRSELEVSRKSLAEALGIAAKSLEAFETGQVSVDAETLVAIAQYLGCQPSAFFRVLGIAAQLRISDIQESHQGHGGRHETQIKKRHIDEEMLKVDLLVQAFRLMSTRS